MVTYFENANLPQGAFLLSLSRPAKKPAPIYVDYYLPFQSYKI